MQGYFALATFVLLIVLVISRVLMLRRLGIRAFKFGEMDKRDFIIPPFVLFFLYVALAGAFGLPQLGAKLFASDAAAWAGVALCGLALALFLWSLLSFGRSFRVGIDEEHPGTLVTSGAFAISRNPIYTAFLSILAGFFLINPNWIILLYLIGGILLINRQVLMEEKSLGKIYGDVYMQYCKKVRRYL
jgi:protein-S-isoprenylcysteine O-methyltransferase Ste14